MSKIILALKARLTCFLLIIFMNQSIASPIEISLEHWPNISTNSSNKFNPPTNLQRRISNAFNLGQAGNTRIIFVPGVGYEKGSERSKLRPYAENISMALDQYTQLYKTSALTLDGSHSPLGDMFHVLAWSRRPAPGKSIKSQTRIYEVANGIAQSWIQNPIDIEAGEQFNLMGFSQGSVTTAQALIDLFRNPSKYGIDHRFKVDYLLLGGSTIRKETRLFKEILHLKDQGKIGVIIYDEAQLPGDIVTGLGGKTILGGIINMIKYIRELATKQGRERNVHYQAASDKDLSTTKFVISALRKNKIY